MLYIRAIGSCAPKHIYKENQWSASIGLFLAERFVNSFIIAASMGRGSSELNTYIPAIGRLTSSALPILILIVGIAIALGTSRPAVAGPILDEPILGGSLLVVNDGKVSVTFLGSDAGYFNTLFLVGLDDPLFDKNTVPFDDENTDPTSSVIYLGPFSAGTELVFRLDVRKTELGDIWQSFYTGDAGRNPDLLAHASAITTFNQLTRTYVTTVGFEDLLGGGDLDFNDFEFRLTNVIDPPVPAPSVLALLGLGLAGIGYRRRKQIKAA